MADPLSVAASIAGLLTAAAAICKVLAPYAAAARDTPQIALQVRSEIEEASISLASLQGLASNLAALPTQRTALIQVEHLVAILTNGVLVFSDLETRVGDLPTPDPSSTPPLRRRLQWTKKESDLKPILGRLQGFKASVSMILGILQSDSLIRAEQWQTELTSNIADLLRSNQDMSRRIMSLEAAFDDSRSCITVKPCAGGIPESQDNASLAPSDTSADDRRDDEEDTDTGDFNSRSISPFEFEEDLNLSMPYRRAKRETIDASPRNSVAFSDARWSMISGISLGNISTLAVLCLPVYADEISNSQHYRFAGKGEPVVDFAILATGVHLEELIAIRRYYDKMVFPRSSCLLEHRVSSGSLLYYDGAVHMNPVRHPTSRDKVLQDRLYIFTDNIVIIRPNFFGGPSMEPALMRFLFNHVSSITPHFSLPARTRRFSFLVPGPRVRAAIDLCEIQCAPAHLDNVEHPMPRLYRTNQIAFPSAARMQKAFDVLAQRHREIRATLGV